MKVQIGILKIMVILVLTGILANESSRFFKSLDQKDYTVTNISKDQEYFVLEENDSFVFDFLEIKDNKISLSNQSTNVKTLSGIIFEILEVSNDDVNYCKSFEKPLVGNHIPIEKRFLSLQLLI